MKSSCPTRHHSLCSKVPANLSSSVFQPEDRSGFPDLRTGDSWSGSPLYTQDPRPFFLLTHLLNFVSYNKKCLKCHPLQDFLGLPPPRTMANCALFAACTPLSPSDSPLLRTRKPLQRLGSFSRTKVIYFPWGLPDTVAST